MQQQESYSEEIHRAVRDSNIDDLVSNWLETFAGLEENDPLMRFIIAAAIVGGSFLLLTSIRLILRRRRHKLEERESSSFKPLRWQAQDLLTSEDMKRLWLSFYRLLGWLVTLVFVTSAIIGVLMLSTRTLNMAAYLLTLILETLQYMWQGFLGYLPDLITIIVILLVVRLVIHTIGVIFEGLKSRRINIRHFYPEWADTSFGLIKLLIYVLTAVIIFPYLPGSSSPAFQGISIFVGVLISLGSTAVVANVVAGIVLTYTRAFHKGDQVEIGGVRGRILERSTFVTRIQTLKNEIVSVPNSVTLNQNIVNFSKTMRGTGILVHTTVTIGYDVSWKKVNELLVAAALKTEHIEAEPEPFVLQKSLDDFYVCYEINGWTHNPQELPRIYSNLHANILDEFHGQNVEIMSPAYQADRDGSKFAIPSVESTTPGPDEEDREK